VKLDSNLVGTALLPYQTSIDWRQTTNFAAATGDRNPRYFDDRNDKKPLSHPMFPVAVTWPVLSRLDQFIDARDFPKAILLTQVHYSEHLILHRLVRPGDELTLKGVLKAFLPHRAGTHAVICMDALDQNGEPVFTEHIGAMLRGVDCGKGGQAGTIPTIPEPARAADALWSSKIHIDPLQPYIYDGCTGIEFPIHTSPNFAQAVGLPGIILQGTATLAHAVREVVDQEAGQDPEDILEIACRFTGMVLPGTDITVVCTGRKSRQTSKDVFFEVWNSEQHKAVRCGYVKIRKRGENEQS
jgi:acyl dehydratase